MRKISYIIIISIFFIVNVVSLYFTKTIDLNFEKMHMGYCGTADMVTSSYTIYSDGKIESRFTDMRIFPF